MPSCAHARALDSALTRSNARSLAQSHSHTVHAPARLCSQVREKQYDVRERLAVYDASGQCVVESALCYIGTPECDNWLGPPEGGVDELAQQIAVAVGPSGPNDEYLFNLAHAMREYGVQDDSLFELERKVKEVQAALRDTAGAAS